MRVRLAKVAWRRNADGPAGEPAKGRLNCPCRNAPDSDFGDGNDVHCACGRVYDSEGWLKSYSSHDLRAIEDAANGKVFKDTDGIEKQMRIEEYEAIYPYPHRVRKVCLYPTRRGMETQAYQEIRQQLGDDWVSDITDNPERWAEVMRMVGVM